MARGKAANTPAPIEPEEESQELLEDEPGADEEAGPAEGKVSKSHAARVAIAEGYENPAKAVAFIKRRFGLDMGAQHFSSIKSQEKKKAEGPGAPPEQEPRAARRKPATAKPEPAAPHPSPTSRTSMKEADFMGDLNSVKALVKKLGADQVHKIVDLFE